MAKAQKETTKQYLDAQAEDFSAEVQALLKTEREIYDMLKEAKANIVAQLRHEMPVEKGKAIVGTAYTRWGQWQIVIDDAPTAKAAPVQRETLAQYRERMALNGRSV